MNPLKTYDSLPQPRQEMIKSLLKVGLLVVGGVILYRKIKSVITEYQNAKALNDITAYDTGKMTVTRAQAEVDAKALYSAMESTGTDTDIIDQVVARYKTADDWNCLIAKFGTPAYGTFGSPMFGSGTPLTLVGWFRRELSGSRLENIISTLRSLGINVE